MVTTERCQPELGCRGEVSSGPFSRKFLKPGANLDLDPTNDLG